MSTRKVLFVLFAGDECRQNHAFLYALDLHDKGHAVKLILEGPATKVLGDVASGSRTVELLRRASAAGIVAGACKGAASLFATDDPARKGADVTTALGVQLLSDLDGHPSIEPFVRDGYQVIVV
jgi:hypothetical protein